MMPYDSAIIPLNKYECDIKIVYMYMCDMKIVYMYICDIRLYICTYAERHGQMNSPPWVSPLPSTRPRWSKRGDVK